MAVTLNKALLIGFVEKEPLVRYTNVDAVVAAFTIETVEEGFVTAKGEQIPEHKEWHRIVAWNDIAKYVESKVRKGSLVSIEGKLRTRSYVDKANVMRYITEVHADKIRVVNDAESINL